MFLIRRQPIQPMVDDHDDTRELYVQSFVCFGFEAIDALVKTSFLCLKSDGTYVRLTEGSSPRPSTMVSDADTSGTSHHRYRPCLNIRSRFTPGERRSVV
jgi:hypothetical protein